MSLDTLSPRSTDLSPLQMEPKLQKRRANMNTLSPPSAAAALLTMTTRARSRQKTAEAEEKNNTAKRIKLDADAKKEKLPTTEEHLDELTAILGATTTTGNLIQLPPELLTIILRYLSPRDLKRFRQINSTWKSTTSRLLQGQQALGIVFSNQHHAKGKSISKLTKLVSCLKKARKTDTLTQFPCIRFEFHGVSLDTKHMQEFLDIFGSSIKTLRLFDCKCKVSFPPAVIDDNSDDDDIPLITTKKEDPVVDTAIVPEKEVVDDGQPHALTRLLQTQATNIETLSIQQHLFTSKTTFTIPADKKLLFPPGIKLPRLTTLKSGFKRRMDRRMLEEILGAANNLRVLDTRIFGSALPLDMLVSMEKIHTIKSMIISISTGRIGFCEKLVSLQPKLSTVTFRLGSLYRQKKNKEFVGRAAAVINKILESSKDTLEEIHGWNPVGFVKLAPIKIPVLAKLKKLTIVNEYGYTNCIADQVFPSGMSLSTVFPNLKQVSIKLMQRNYGHLGPPMDAENYWKKFFPFINTLEENQLPNVETLRIGYMPLNSHPGFSWWFPNLKNLVIDYTEDEEFSVPAILKDWKNIQSLELLNIKAISVLLVALTGSKQHETLYDGLGLNDDDDENHADLPELVAVNASNSDEPKLPKVEVLNQEEKSAIQELTDLKSLGITAELLSSLNRSHRDRLVKVLASLKNLQHLRIKGIEFPDEAVKEIEEALGPHAHIQLGSASDGSWSQYDHRMTDRSASDDNESLSDYDSSSDDSDGGPGGMFGLQFGFGLVGMLLGLGGVDSDSSLYDSDSD